VRAFSGLSSDADIRLIQDFQLKIGSFVQVNSGISSLVAPPNDSVPDINQAVLCKVYQFTGSTNYDLR